MKPSPVTRHTAYCDLPEWMSIDEIRRYLDIGRTAAYELARAERWQVLRAGKLIRVHKSAFAPIRAASAGV